MWTFYLIFVIIVCCAAQERDMVISMHNPSVDIRTCMCIFTNDVSTCACRGPCIRIIQCASSKSAGGYCSAEVCKCHCDDDGNLSTSNCALKFISFDVLGNCTDNSSLFYLNSQRKGIIFLAEPERCIVGTRQPTCDSYVHPMFNRGTRCQCILGESQTCHRYNSCTVHGNNVRCNMEECNCNCESAKLVCSRMFDIFPLNQTCADAIPPRYQPIQNYRVSSRMCMNGLGYQLDNLNYLDNNECMCRKRDSSCNPSMCELLKGGSANLCSAEQNCPCGEHIDSCIRLIPGEQRIGSACQCNCSDTGRALVSCNEAKMVSLSCDQGASNALPTGISAMKSDTSAYDSNAVDDSEIPDISNNNGKNIESNMTREKGVHRNTDVPDINSRDGIIDGRIPDETNIDDETPRLKTVQSNLTRDVGEESIPQNTNVILLDKKSNVSRDGVEKGPTPDEKNNDGETPRLKTVQSNMTRDVGEEGVPHNTDVPDIKSRDGVIDDRTPNETNIKTPRLTTVQSNMTRDIAKEGAPHNTDVPDIKSRDGVMDGRTSNISYGEKPTVSSTIPNIPDIMENETNNETPKMTTVKSHLYRDVVPESITRAGTNTGKFTVDYEKKRHRSNNYIVLIGKNESISIEEPAIKYDLMAISIITVSTLSFISIYFIINRCK